MNFKRVRSGQRLFPDVAVLVDLGSEVDEVLGDVDHQNVSRGFGWRRGGAAFF